MSRLQTSAGLTPIMNVGWFHTPTSSLFCSRFSSCSTASSQVDHRKVGRLALRHPSGVSGTRSLSRLHHSDSSRLERAHAVWYTVQSIENAKHNTELGRISSPPEDSLTAASEESNLRTLQSELQQALQREIADRTVALHRETDGLVISLREFGFFDSGSRPR